MFVRVSGRSCSCVLALLTLILFPAMARSQSATVERADVGRDLPLTIRPTQPLSPISISPRAIPPVTAPPRPIGPTAPWRPPNPPLGTYGLAQLTAAAGTIFSGTVTTVTRQPAVSSQPASTQAVETVAVTFHVEQAIRGATPGDNFTLTQWMGVWSGGQRYRVGERLLLFLYPTSKLGLTSCVGGSLGRFTIDPWGMVHFSAQHLTAFHADPLLAGKSRVTFGDFATAVQQAKPRMVEAE
jgi:hypothetical protein